MGFALENQTERLQEREIKGRYQKVAVSCWYTTSGKSMPQLVKYEDSEGMVQCIRNIQLVKTEEKHFAGIWMRRYDCCAEDEGVMKYFTLLYHMEEATWDMVW